jgi:multidrug efflux pump subunit AcrB
MLGLISLIGVIVRNGIIMFDYAEELRVKQKKNVLKPNYAKSWG